MADLRAFDPDPSIRQIVDRRAHLRMVERDRCNAVVGGGQGPQSPGESIGVEDIDVQDVDEGALADLILVDGDPIANLDLIKDPKTNFLVIMKDGMIYKGM